uniref:UBN2 domain-containing protein n=1 Tax=Manihot esculenta TaxID=3983 RepID=A0A2C9UWI5_MANES
MVVEGMRRKLKKNTLMLIGKGSMQMLVHDFKLFEMKPGKTIAEMSTTFTHLVNLLKALGKIFEEAELVKKILRSLSKSWEAKITVIFDTKGFIRYTYDELIGSLIAHEMMFKKKVTKKEKGKKCIALK